MNPFILTASGRRYYFLDPDPREIVIEDIATSLERLCRFTGHVELSVAEHSVQVWRRAIELGADERTRRAALLHDAHEAFVGDLSSPLKAALRAIRLDVDSLDPLISAFDEIDRRASAAIGIRFGFPAGSFDAALVHRADADVTHAEAVHFFGTVWPTPAAPIPSWRRPCDEPLDFGSACRLVGVAPW